MKLWHLLESLANLVRTGWMQRGVPPALGESVAMHSFYAAMIALEIGEKLKKRGINVDPLKASAIALTHDIGEALVGDMPKWSTDRIKEVKENLELEALNSMNLEVIKYAKEYFNNSKESIVAKVSETLATLWQAQKYVEMGLKRVKEIEESMKGSLEKTLKRAEELDEAFGKALREVIKDI